MDGDAAGLNATKKHIKTFLRIGVRVKVAILPKKKDPYSFVKEMESPEKGFQMFLDAETKDGLIWLVMQDYDKNDPHSIGETIELAGKLIFLLKNNSIQHSYISTLTKDKYLGNVKKQIQEALHDE